MKKVILLHGKDKTSKDVWYPWIKQELEKQGVPCETPDLPRSDDPKIAEWLAVIDSLAPDNKTILVGHSRGGMAIMRWLERTNRTVAKVVLVAANGANVTDQTDSDFYSGPYNFERIRAHCPAFVVLHSTDDAWVPYAAALENAAGLHAQLVTLRHKNHFGRRADGTYMSEFPELLQLIAGTSLG